MAAKPLSNIHFVGIVAEWLVAYWKRTRTRFESQRGTKPAYNPYRHCAGMPPSVQAAKPGPRRGAVQRPTLNNQAASKMLGLQFGGVQPELNPSFIFENLMDNYPLIYVPGHGL